MLLRTISCYLYDSEDTAFLLQGVIRFVQARSLMNVILQKSWIHGFHVKITYPVTETDNGLESTVRRLAERYGRIRGQSEYQSFEAILHKMAELENYNGAYLPLRKDGEVTVYEGEELQHGNPVASARVNYEIELLKTHLLLDLYDIWEELAEDQQNIECAKMFLTSVNRSAGSLKFGYMSLRSNFEYFKNQIELSNKQGDAERKIWDALFSRTEDEQDFVMQGIRRFAEGRYEREFIFGRMQIFIDCLLSVLSQAFDDGELTLEKLRQEGDFFQRYDAFNDFHWTLHSNSEFLKHYHEKGFVIYRFVASVLYNLMSLLEVSAIRKQRIIGMVSESVEYGFSMSWRDAYMEMSAAQLNAEASERLVH